MGTKLSPVREQFPVLPGLERINRGKVRDTYVLDDNHLLISASDAVSIFDHVLNATIPQKGIILNLLSHFWFNQLKRYGILSHRIAAGVGMNPMLPEHLRDNADLLTRSMIVQRLTMTPVEFIARGYLTGSGLKAYNESGMVCGHTLPKGFIDGDKLPFILDTPTTKADVGHDEHLDADAIRATYPEETYLLIKSFQLVWNYLYERGILLADTKLEMGRHPKFEIPIIGDEAFTPDSSRFWERAAWEKLNASRSGKTPPPFDKQVIRNWGLTLGINKRDPENPEDVAWVHEQQVPDDIIRIAAQTYRYIFWRITGKTVEEYASFDLGVRLGVKAKRVVVLLGSMSDKAAIENILCRDIMPNLADRNITMAVHVLSCHRNPNELLQFVEEGCDRADVIVAAGGKAFQLPGILDAFIAAKGMHIPVVGVALGSEGSTSRLAAELSIAEIPGEPVVMNEISGSVYGGPEGFSDAMERVTRGELPPQKIREGKPAAFNVTLVPHG